MTELTGNDDSLFAKRMIEDGYFPSNLPPVFRVSNLSAATRELLSSGIYTTEKATECAKYNATKNRGQRRIFSVPNPTLIVDLASFFIKYKQEINEHLKGTSDSNSFPKFTATGPRPIAITPIAEFHRLSRKVLSLSRYVIRTDISKFYHSIYTHSIPWALHGKQNAKSDRKPDSSTTFGNRLDWLLRQSQDGQTIGIPVGPDFSRIISEIIGTSIDQKFRSICTPDTPMLRYVDDIYIGCDNLDEANHHLSSIRNAIRSLELDINDSKTEILSSNNNLEPFWPVLISRELEIYHSSDRNNGRRKFEFVQFLDEIVRISNSIQNESPIKYFIKLVDKLRIWDKYWDVIEPFLISVAVNFPQCWEYVARVVAMRNRITRVDIKNWRSTAHITVKNFGKSGYDSEITWAVWLLKELDEGIERDTLEVILDNCGPIPILIALDVNINHRSGHKIKKEKLIDRFGRHPMLGANWLLAYECDRQFGFSIKTKNIYGNQLFRKCYDNDVSFYDSKLNSYHTSNSAENNSPSTDQAFLSRNFDYEFLFDKDDSEANERNYDEL